MSNRYKHNKTGGIYILLQKNVLDVTNGRETEMKVIYQAEHSKKIFSRNQSEFFDGRFTKIEEAAV